MTPYKGIIRITCGNKTCDKKLLRPEAACVNCTHAGVAVLDLDGNVVASQRAPLAATARDSGAKKKRR